LTNVTLGLLVFSLLAVGPFRTNVQASSHREAPSTSVDTQVDNTDVYAFVSPEDTSTVTIIANYYPFLEPAGGPNFYLFGDSPRVVYEINIDNNGDARADIRVRYRFRTTVRNLTHSCTTRDKSHPSRIRT